MPSRVKQGDERGWIVPIGGGEDKDSNPQVLQRFVDLCGGADADIVVIPSASRLADMGEHYENVFGSLGAGQVTTLDFDTRRDAAEANRVARLREASGIFFTGGNQVRIATTIGGTPVAKAVRECNARGVPVGGTSAGASILSDHMMVGGDKGGTPVAGNGQTAPGLGLTNRFIIDQHFRERDRLGRLLAALAWNPYPIGLGLDEDTAAFIGPDNVLEVEGSGAVTVVDANELQFSSMAQLREGEPICMLGIKVHILTAGARFDLDSRTASAGTLAASKSVD